MENNLLSLFLAYCKNRSVEKIRLSDSILEFQYQTRQFVFIYDAEKDKNFIRLMLPRIDTYASVNIAQNSLICNLTSKYKVGKCIVLNDEVWLSAEQFIYATGGESLIFDRMMSLLIQMYQEYTNEISKL